MGEKIKLRQAAENAAATRARETAEADATRRAEWRKSNGAKIVDALRCWGLPALETDVTFHETISAKDSLYPVIATIDRVSFCWARKAHVGDGLCMAVRCERCEVETCWHAVETLADVGDLLSGRVRPRVTCSACTQPPDETPKSLSPSWGEQLEELIRTIAIDVYEENRS